MNIQRFFALSSREAMNKVRMSLGEDAIILSNKQVNGGYEILAFREEELSAAESRAGEQSAKRANEEKNEPETLLSMIAKKNRTALPEATMETPEIFSPINMRPEPDDSVMGSKTMSDMLKEIRNMRSVIESQLTEIAWGNIQQRDPIKSGVLGKLLAAGFSADLSRQMAKKLPAVKTGAEADHWVRSVLSKNIQTVQNESEILDKGGVFALVGPTGVGKTTTTAKLAARYVMKHGTNKLGLITTDAYRVGGHEQLRIYGKILGVMVHAVKDEVDLQIALHELKNKHTILIDTVGVSQRDRMVAEQIAMLSSADTPIKKLLCLNATNTGETLTDVINAYKGRGLDGCIVTKLDEAVTIGSTLDVIIREKLKLHYIANGQRVPEDLHLINKEQLVQHAFKLGSQKNRPFQFTDEELPFLMANSMQSAAHPAMTELNYA